VTIITNLIKITWTGTVALQNMCNSRTAWHYLRKVLELGDWTQLSVKDMTSIIPTWPASPHLWHTVRRKS